MTNLSSISSSIASAARAVSAVTGQIDRMAQKASTSLQDSDLETGLNSHGLSAVSALMNDLSSLGTSAAGALDTLAHAVTDPVANLASGIATVTGEGTVLGSVLSVTT